MPPTITPGNAILAAVAEHANADIPLTLRFHLNLALLSYEWVNTLGHDTTAGSGLCSSPENLVEAFDNHCAQLRQRFPAPWPKLGDISYYATQLQVHSFAINKHINSPGDRALEATVQTDLIQAKSLATLVRLITEASKSVDSISRWPVFAKYHVMLAASLSVYMAASTSERMTRIALLQAAKDSVPILKRFSVFPKDHFARISRHISTAIRRVEGLGPSAVSSHASRPAVRARMAANIPYQVRAQRPLYHSLASIALAPSTSKLVLSHSREMSTTRS